MKTTGFIPIAISMLLIVSAFGGCSTSHQTMRGSVLMKFEDRVHICIGTDDGIQVGDIMFVYRVKVDNTRWLSEYQRDVPTARNGRPSYRKIKVGEAKVVELFDGHFAAVTLISGELQSNDIVEKQRLR
ncbi:MAG TPA: hypothetical protein VJN65_05615 [Bacteroidota bacterium]|nr:hypothetical protein [Bacteroidota bacterium]